MKFLSTFGRMAIAGLIVFSSCKKEETDTPVNPGDPLNSYTLVGAGEAGMSGYMVELYAQVDPFVGYNRMVVRVKENGTMNEIDDAVVTFDPVMDMMGLGDHGTPVEQPVYNEALRGYAGTATFVMPSGMMGTWTFRVKISLPGVKDDYTAEITVNVILPAEERLYSFLSETDSASIWVALVDPVTPEIGFNDFEVVIYEMEDEMTWPAIGGLQIEIEPIMPSMSHGSPGNVNPTFLDAGHYLGKVNFTMPGWWRVYIDIRDGEGNLMDDKGYIDITL